MAEMGIRNYRFSISWPRVLPEGVGRVNEEGLQFYSDLVDCLLAHGIPALLHPLPLGSAPGAARKGRVAQRGDARLV